MIRPYLGRAMALVAAPAIAFGLSSCGGALVGGGGSQLQSEYGQGGVAGYVYRATATGALSLGYTAVAPAGMTPAAGVSLKIDGVPGGAAAGADGSFAILAVPTGPRTLLAGTDRVPVTVFDHTTVQVGDPPVTRSQAIAVALAEAAKTLDVAGAEVVSARQPLPPGAEVAPAIGVATGAADAAPYKSATSQWFVFINPTPDARWEHDALYVFVDASAGTVAKRAARSWPVINGCEYYRRSDWNASSPDLVQAGTRKVTPPAAASAPTTRVVRSTPAGLPPTRADDCPNPKTYALLIRGDTGLGMEYDGPHVKTWLGSTPFPPAAPIEQIVCPGSAQPKDDVMAAWTRICNSAAACDTVFLYISSHGSLGPDHRFTLRYPWAGKDGQRFGLQEMSPQEFDWSKCKACRIVIMVDTCYSGWWLPQTEWSLWGMNGREIVLLTSAASDRYSYGFPQDFSTNYNGASVTLPAGGVFTSSMMHTAPGAFTTGKIYSDLGGAYAAASPLANFINAAIGTTPQNPAQWMRPVRQDEKCECGSEEVHIQ